MVVAEAGDTIFTPTIGATARPVVTEVIPGSSIRTIVFANRSPLALAQVRSPEPPRCSPTVRLFQSLLLLQRGPLWLVSLNNAVPRQFPKGPPGKKGAIHLKNRSTAVGADLGAFIRRKRINYSGAGQRTIIRFELYISLSCNNHFEEASCKIPIQSNPRSSQMTANNQEIEE